MKRPIIIGLTTIALVGLVGCSKPNDTKIEDNNSQTTQGESSNVVNDDIKPSNFLGKVSGIVGNQVTIKLIDGDFELTDEMKAAMGIIELSDDQIKQLESGEIIEMPGGGSMGMATVGGAPEESTGSFEVAELDPSISVEDLQEQGIDIEAEMRAENEAIFNQIEFNGESKEFTIQAGVPIYNSITGQEVKLSEIKKGSIVDFMIDENTNTIIRVDIRL